MNIQLRNRKLGDEKFRKKSFRKVFYYRTWEELEDEELIILASCERKIR